MATMLKASVQKLNPQTTCVLVCDVQQRFTEIIFGFQELVKCSSYLVKVANALDLPVVCTEQYPKAFKQTVPELSTLIQQKDKNKTFEKTMFSMATPEVMSHLSSMGIESCVLCGLETHVCILQTTLDMVFIGIGIQDIDLLGTQEIMVLIQHYSTMILIVHLMYIGIEVSICRIRKLTIYLNYTLMIMLDSMMKVMIHI